MTFPTGVNRDENLSGIVLKKGLLALGLVLACASAPAETGTTTAPNFGDYQAKGFLSSYAGIEAVGGDGQGVIGVRAHFLLIFVKNVL
jgi:hypothetical protein